MPEQPPRKNGAAHFRIKLRNEKTENMPEPNVKRYPISTPAPRPFKLSDFSMARDQDGEDLTFETTIRGEVSLGMIHFFQY